MKREPADNDRCEGPAATPAAWAGAIVRLDVKERARVLSRLLALVGPLALAVLGGGAFAKYMRPARKSPVTVTVDDAARATWSQVHELVRYVQQSHPGVIAGLPRPAPCVRGPQAGFATIR